MLTLIFKEDLEYLAQRNISNYLCQIIRTDNACGDIMLKDSLVSGHNSPYFMCESSYTKIGAQSNVFGCLDDKGRGRG